MVICSPIGSINHESVLRGAETTGRIRTDENDIICPTLRDASYTYFKAQGKSWELKTFESKNLPWIVFKDDPNELANHLMLKINCGQGGYLRV
jgi:hypothetical protein